MPLGVLVEEFPLEAEIIAERARWPAVAERPNVKPSDLALLRL
jgi:hypothetical protein